jgi:hypothetical protein
MEDAKVVENTGQIAWDKRDALHIKLISDFLGSF